MHIGLLMFYTPAEDLSGPVRFKDILDTFKRRIHCAPIFHRTLGKVPLGIDYPFWLDAEDVDVEFHVRHIALSAPGDWRQFCIQVARLQARMVDRRRPLWEAYVIEKLDNIDFLPAGSFAVLFKMHHAAVDGGVWVLPQSGGFHFCRGPVVFLGGCRPSISKLACGSIMV